MTPLARREFLLVRHDGPILDPGWGVSDVRLEDLVLAYIGKDVRGPSAGRKLRGGLMIRVAYWQFRLPLGIAPGGLAVVAVIAGLTGPGLAHLYDTTVATCASNGGYCSAALNSFNAHDHAIRVAAQAILLGLPAILGMFWGAPLAARERESGTFRLAWPQGHSRLRWPGAKLAVVGLTTLTVQGLLSLISRATPPAGCYP